MIPDRLDVTRAITPADHPTTGWPVTASPSHTRPWEFILPIRDPGPIHLNPFSDFFVLHFPVSLFLLPLLSSTSIGFCCAYACVPVVGVFFFSLPLSLPSPSPSYPGVRVKKQLFLLCRPAKPYTKRPE